MGGFLTIDYCSITIVYCFPIFPGNHFFWGKGLIEGDKVVIGGIPQVPSLGKTLDTVLTPWISFLFILLPNLSEMTRLWRIYKAFFYIILPSLGNAANVKLHVRQFKFLSSHIFLIYLIQETIRPICEYDLLI